MYLLVYVINIRKVGDSIIMNKKYGHRIIQELSQCLFSACFNSSINCLDYVLYEEKNTEN
jgi:hypothetical protein